MEKTYRKFTSESVSSGHPDKMADQISDAVLDDFLRQDPNSRVACETFLTDGLVVVGGEAHSDAYVDIKSVARNVIKKIGYTPETCFDPDNFGLICTLHEQSNDIRMGVDKMDEKDQGAGDQGIMFGYATNETCNYIPASHHLANQILMELEEQRKSGGIIGLGPDAKSQVTLNLDDNGKPLSVDTILVSTQHLPNKNISQIRNEIIEIVIKNVIKDNFDLSYLFDNSYRLLINPTGRFVVGGPKGDTGLTGRKIIVDTYGGYGAHGGGCFSGKDGSKVDRSGAYMARYLAKNIVHSGICNRCLIQLSYGIGLSQPISVHVKTDMGLSLDDKLTENIIKNVDLSPYGIIERFKLKTPIYYPTSCYGHFGKTPYTDKFGNEYFGWEKTDISDLIVKNA